MPLGRGSTSSVRPRPRDRRAWATNVVSLGSNALPELTPANQALGDPYGTRTRVFAVRGRRPGPLDEGAISRS